MSRKKHATLSASSSERWIACPGSIRMSDGKESHSSVYAREGTAAHDLAERALRRNISPRVWLGETINVEGDEIEVTEEMVEAVCTYFVYCRDLQERSSLSFIEQRFSLERMHPPAAMFGTSDFVSWDEKTKTLEIVDFKYGQGVAVEANNNPQLKYYALGAIVKLGQVPKLVRTTVIQPRAPHPAGPIRSAEYTWQEMVTFKFALMDAALKTQEPDAPLSAGDHCRFCPALAECPAHMQLVESVAQAEFMLEQPAQVPAPEQLTEDQLQRALHYADTIEEWLAAVREYAQVKLERGESVPGWKLVAKRAVRRWTSEEEAEAAMSSVLGDAAYTKKLVSPAQAEKALKQINMKLPEELVEKVSSGKKLARESDPRPARLPSAQSDFMDEN